MCLLVNKGRQHRRTFPPPQQEWNEWWWSCQNTVNLVILSRLSSKALLEFKYRHVVGLVGLCNRIFHTMVYRLLLFYIGNEMCIFNCPEGSGIPRYIIACVTIQLWLFTFHAVWESIYFCFAKHFPGSIQTVVCTVYILYRHSYLANKLLYY